MIVETLSKAILHAKKEIKYCSICCNITDKDPCNMCSNKNRDNQYHMCSGRSKRCSCNGKNKRIQRTISCT